MDEHSYFRSIEERFIDLRGAPLLLSPSDYQVAKRWWSEGIPLELIHGALEELFARRAEQGGGRPIQSLRYCAPAVEAAWGRAGELQRAGHRVATAPIEIGARLEALAGAIPDSLPGSARLRARISALEGGAEAIENSLVDLDRELLDAAAASLPPDARAALEENVARRLASYGERWAGTDLGAARARLLEQALRRELELPVLSLFAP